MIATSIKLNSATFDYYILRINSNSLLQEIQSKLITLREFDKTSRHLVIECDSQLDLNLFAEQIKQIETIAANYELSIGFILANQFTRGGIIAGKPVIELPSTIKPQLIMNQTLLIEEPVRSGMMVKNDGDIIVTSLVSHNAEVIATGNIHVYGDCRGRVIAGNGGNKKSKIFIGRFNAELISIAGVYRVIEDKLPESLHNKAVQVFLDDKERLNITPLAI